MMRNLLALALPLLMLSPMAYAAQIMKVKGGGALVDLQGDKANPGDTFFTMSSDGKKRGIVQITKVKGDRAIVKILKGKVDQGMTLQARGGGSSVASGGSRKKVGNSGEPAMGRSFWGGMVGVNFDSLKVQVLNNSTQQNETATLSGTSFSALGMYDYEMFPYLWFRGMGGIEGFSAAGSSVCGTLNNSACNASIYYLAGDALARLVLPAGDFRPWAGVGIELMFPVSKTSTALSTSSISVTNVIQIAGGVDWFISPGMYIPISLEYGLFPTSNAVTANWIEFRAGLGVPF